MDLATNVLTLFLLVFQAFGSCDGRIAYTKNPSDVVPMNKSLGSLGVSDYDRTLHGRYSDERSTHFSGHVSRSRWHSANGGRPAEEEWSPWSEKY